MALFYRKRILEKISKYLLKKGTPKNDLDFRGVMKLTDANNKYSSQKAQLKIPLDVFGSEEGSSLEQVKSTLKGWQTGDVEGVTQDCRYLYVKIKTHKYNQHVLRAVQQERELYGYKDSDGTRTPQHILVEYSSPNIAKPFHAGHLRSTLLGNFVSNLYEALGHKVTRLNYLGDWGTQFGLLLTGYHRYGCSEKLGSDSLQHLFEVYVRVNQDVEKEKSAGLQDTYREALDSFTTLEKGDPRSVDLWQQFRSISLTEYDELYQRLGIKFSDIHFESMYNRGAKALVDQLLKAGFLLTDENGVCYAELHKGGRSQRVTMLKSDGSTLYISRDVAAAIDRYKKYRFDKIHYVVDMSQSHHFHQLQGLLDALGHTWCHHADPHFHVGFGQIEGMSTRHGQVIFLRDLLDEAKQRTLETLHNKETTRVASTDLDAVAEILGISSVIIQDFREKRRTNYRFNWDRMLYFKADSGIFLQYCHARLCSVLRSYQGGTYCRDSSPPTEDVASRLIQHIAGFPDVVQETMQTLEPCVIVHYLFRLGHLVNAAYKFLPVKYQDESTAQTRLLLFDCSRQTLSNGLQLLGITPLDKL